MREAEEVLVTSTVGSSVGLVASIGLAAASIGLATTGVGLATTTGVSGAAAVVTIVVASACRGSDR